MGQIWFTSDTHFGHVRISEFCPGRVEAFGMDGPNDVPTMNAGMVEVWNQYIKPGDTVYHLGDLAMGKITDSLSYVAQLHGDITLIWGNHDRPHPCYNPRWTTEKRYEWVQQYADAGIHIQKLDDMMDIAGVPVKLNHFPYSGDTEGGDRYPTWRPEDHGLILVHGHVHDMWQVEGCQINVGWDAWERPLHIDEVGILVSEINESS